MVSILKQASLRTSGITKNLDMSFTARRDLAMPSVVDGLNLGRYRCGVYKPLGDFWRRAYLPHECSGI